ncbi:MAG: hypothetical protein ACTHM8_09855 [Sphingomonas sp.]
MRPDGSPQDGAEPSEPGFLAEAAFSRLLLEQRRRREQALGADRFADPVWDMMLDLFIAQVEGNRMAMSSLVIGAGVPQSTALRRIRMLVQEGGFVANGDPHDGRRTFVRLSEALFQEIGELLRAWREADAALLAAIDNKPR